MVLIIFVLIIQLPIQHTYATTPSEIDKRNVLIVYFGEDKATIGNVHFLEGTFSGLFENVSTISFDLLEKETIKKKDILVFYSAREVEGYTEQLKIINQFKGELLGIGKGATILNRLQQWGTFHSTVVGKLGNYPFSIPIPIIFLSDPGETNVLVYGYSFNEEYPVIVQNGSDSFIGLNEFISEERYELTKALYEIFKLKTPPMHLAYIRLEDISPVSDPKLVLEAGNYLLDEGIPVYLSVIPVYVNNKSGQVISLEDVPQLREVLTHLVQRGAYVIAHGYTHTYRYTETGEGFEFWDSALNQPITTLDIAEAPKPLKGANDFTTISEYEQYMSSIWDLETSYINDKLEKSINLLTKLGYPPITFEAPHYTMSSNGYKTTSNYFSSIFGQIQLSNDDWQLMSTPLIVSKPAILNGMMLYPETIGYIDPSVNDPIGELEKNINRVTQVPGAMLGGFYHPYLGIDYLKEMVALLQKVPNIKWLDLKHTKQFVKSSLVEIELPGDGAIFVNSKLTWDYELREYMNNKPFEVSLWIIVLVTAIFILIFIIYIMTFRLRYRKRLFEER